MKQKGNTMGISPQQTLVYSSFQPGLWDLYEIDQLNATNITLGESLNYNPVYSPDGRYIVFTSERMGTAHLFCLDTEDKNKPAFRLSNNSHFEDQATFSPDGQKIYFVSTHDNDNPDIFVMGFNTHEMQEITLATNLTKGKGNNLRPSISPDGKEIAFSSNRFHAAPKILLPQPPANYRATNIFKMNLQSGELKQLTNSEEWDGSPVWSSDGKTIYFYSTRALNNKKDPHIYSMTSEGHDLKMISPENIPALSPKLAPNGRIAFTGNFNGHLAIASIDPNSVEKDIAPKIESDSRRNYYGAFFHPKTSQCIAYGDAPETKDKFHSENPTGLPKPLGVGPFLINHYQQSRLENIDHFAVRGLFPHYDPQKKQILCVENFNQVVLIDTVDNTKKIIFVEEKTKIIGISWSPDKEWFVAAIGDAFTNNPSDIWKISMDSETNNETKVNLTAKMTGHKMFPRISVDNNTIVFCSSAGREMHIYSVNKESLEIKKLTHNSARNFAPAISPRGSRVVYSSVTTEENYNLYLINTTGEGEPERLTSSTYADLHPAFSSDGQSVVFSSDRGGLLDETPLNPVFCPQPYGDIYTVQLNDRSKVTRMTQSKWESSLAYSTDLTEVSGMSL